MSLRAYVIIESEKGQADTVAAELYGMEGILTTDQVFGQYDIVALIVANDLERLAMIVRNEIAPLDHIIRTETLIVSSIT